MRSSLLIPILLFLLPFSTFAAPHQRRSPVGTVPGVSASEAAAGSSEGVANAAENAAAQAATHKPLIDVPGAPAPKAQPEIDFKELEAPPPEVKPSFMQKVKNLWKKTGAAARKTIQAWVDALIKKTNKGWKEEGDKIQAKTDKFQAEQAEKARAFREAQDAENVKFMEKQRVAFLKNDAARDRMIKFFGKVSQTAGTGKAKNSID